MNGRMGTFGLGAVLALSIALAAPLVQATGLAGGPASIAVDISPRLKGELPPAQPDFGEATEAAAAGATQFARCFGDGETRTITLPSWDPANPGYTDTVFFKETVSTSTGQATLWVAWDHLATAYGRADVVTCEQLAYLQGAMDRIVDTDKYYFGDFEERPAGNANLDVMIYNIQDESFFDAEFPFYIAGYFWGGLNDAFQANMIFIDTNDWANRLGPDVLHPYLYEGTVAHELQHLIHNDHDGNEASWVDEGLADLSEYLNGFGHPAGHVVYYLAYHRTPLTIWGGGLENYGASYLFHLYLLENFGAKQGGLWTNAWTRRLIDEQANGIAGVENAMAGASGRPIAFNAVYDAWTLANYADVPNQHDANGLPLGYDEIDVAPFVSGAYSPWSIARSIDEIYGATHRGDLPVHRYYGGFKSGTVEYPKGVLPPYAPLYGSYAGMQPKMQVTVRGAAASGLAPAEGTYEAASGAGNMLTDRVLTLDTPVGGVLSFQTWFDIEEEWDYGFVEASTDGGFTWAPLPGSITRSSTNPNASTAWANSLVGGLPASDAVITGASGGWVDATFVLPAASGVLVRFNYYTDESANGRGWFVDDVRTASFADGFEAGAAAWTLGGWQRTTGLFPNAWAAGYVNPISANGKFLRLELGYIPEVAGPAGYQVLSGRVDTARLYGAAAVVVVSNRPGEAPFDADYLLLVDKVAVPK